MSMSSSRGRSERRLRVCAQQLLPQAVQSADDVDVDALSTAFMGSQALMVALEIGVFDHLSRGPLTAGDLGAACGISSPRLQTLLTALVALKCLRLDPTSLKYTNSPNIARFMVSSSKDYYGDYVKLQMGRLFYPQMGQITPIMKGEKVLTYQTWFQDREVADLYTAAQHNGSLATARTLFKRISLTGVTSLLDVGGGSGAFSVVATRAAPGLSATVLDLPEVCRKGTSIVKQEGCSDSVRFVELDATSPDWPVSASSFQVVLMSYLSGSVPVQALAGLYSNAFKALLPGGRLIVHDVMVNDALDGPEHPALWALQHACVNPEGLGLTAANVTAHLKAAGFARTEAMKMIGGLTKAVVAYKA